MKEMLICLNSKMIVYLTSFLFSAAVSAISSSRVDIVYPSIESTRLGEKIIKFRALDQNIHLKLEPAGDVIADDLTVKNGANENIDHLNMMQNIKRKLYKDKKMGAALYVDDERFVIVDGIINSQLKIEPYHLKNLNKIGKVAHRVSEITTDENAHIFDKVVHTSLKNDLNEGTRQLIYNYCVEVSLILDSNFIGRFPDNHSVFIYLSNTMNGVQLMFDTLGLGIKIKLAHTWFLYVNESLYAPYIRMSDELLNENGHLATFQNMDKLLSEMANYFCINANVNNPGDVVLLISGKRFISYRNGTYIQGEKGLAYIGGACSRCTKYGIIEDNAYTTFNRHHLISHEIGHLLGAAHNGMGPTTSISNSPGSEDCSSCEGCVMNAMIPPNSRKFSCCSRENIKNFLTLGRASCLMGNC